MHSDAHFSNTKDFTNHANSVYDDLIIVNPQNPLILDKKEVTMNCTGEELFSTRTNMLILCSVLILNCTD